MENQNEQKLADNALAQVIAQFEDNLAELEAFDAKGSVLFVEESGMALNFAENGQPYQCGLQHARVFSDAERGLGGGQRAVELKRQYQNGNGCPAMLYDVEVAKRIVKDNLLKCIDVLKAKYA